MFPITRFNPLQSFPQWSFRFSDWPKNQIFHVLLVFVPRVTFAGPPRTTLYHFVMTGLYFHRLAMSGIM